MLEGFLFGATLESDCSSVPSGLRSGPLRHHRSPSTSQRGVAEEQGSVECCLVLALSLVYLTTHCRHSIGSTSLQTRLDAGLVHATTVKSVPFDNDVAVYMPPQQSRKSSKRSALKSVAKYTFSFLAIASTITAVSSPPAYAAKAAQETVEHLHVGQKIANYFRSFGIPDLAVLAMISAMPVVELRGAVPVGVWMGLPITKVLPVCVLGNMVPIVPLLFLLRNDKLK